MGFHRRQDILDPHPLHRLHFFFLKLEFFDLYRLFISKNMTLLMILKDPSMELAFIASVMDPDKPQVFRLCRNSQLFLQLPERRLQIVLSRRNMPGAGDIVAAPEGVLPSAPLL